MKINKKLLLPIGALCGALLGALIYVPLFAKATYLYQSNLVNPVAVVSTTVPVYNYSYVSTNNNTTTIKLGSGTLHTLSFGTVATSSVITLFDSTGTATGTVIAKITLNATTTYYGFPESQLYDVSFLLGLVEQQTGNTSTFTLSWQ